MIAVTPRNITAKLDARDMCVFIGFHTIVRLSNISKNAVTHKSLVNDRKMLRNNPVNMKIRSPFVVRNTGSLPPEVSTDKKYGKMKKTAAVDPPRPGPTVISVKISPTN